MRPANPNFAPRLARRRKRFVVTRKHLTPLGRVLVFAGRWKWLGVLVGLGITAAWGWWFGRRHHWLNHFQAWLNAGSQIVADPSHLAEVLIGIGIVVVLALWWLPKWQAAGSQDISAENWFDRENEARKTLAQIVGGVLLLAGPLLVGEDL